MKLFPRLMLVIALAGCVGRPAPEISGIGRGHDAAAAADKVSFATVLFTVRYPEGWTAWTSFSRDGTVRGGHLSGGEKPVVHLVEDAAPATLVEETFGLAARAWDLGVRCPSVTGGEPVYAIEIGLTDGSARRYATNLKASFDDQVLAELAVLLDRNQRIYSHQRGTSWYNVDGAQIDPATPSR
jgi:hypothetical protein